MDRTRRPSTALVISLAALIVACAGTSLAASRYVITSSRQVKPGAIALGNVSKSARKALHGLRGPAGPKGPAGAAGPAGSATIANGSIGTAQLADGSVTQNKFAPAMAVKVVYTGSTGESLLTGNSAPVTFDRVDFDTGGFVDPLTPTRITVPLDGTYMIAGSVAFAANGSGGRGVFIQTQNQAIAQVYGPAAPFDVTGTTYSASSVVRLHRGDTITMNAYQTSGATLYLAPGGVTPTGGTFLSAAWIGP